MPHKKGGGRPHITIAYYWEIKQQQNKTELYRKVPKFSDARKLCCNLSKIETKSPNLRVFCQSDANRIANSEDPDQTAPLGAV